MQYRELTFQENLLDIRIAEGKSIDAITRSPIMNHMEVVQSPSFLVIQDTQFTHKN